MRSGPFTVLQTTLSWTIHSPLARSNEAFYLHGVRAMHTPTNTHQSSDNGFEIYDPRGSCDCLESEDGSHMSAIWDQSARRGWLNVSMFKLDSLQPQRLPDWKLKDSVKSNPWSVSNEIRWAWNFPADTSGALIKQSGRNMQSLHKEQQPAHGSVSLFGTQHSLLTSNVNDETQVLPVKLYN